MSIEHLIGPIRLVERIDHGKWHFWPIGGISTSWIAGIWAQVDGTHVVNLIALGVLGIGGALMGVYRIWERDQAARWKQHEIDQIEIDEKRRESLARVPQPTIIFSPATPAIKQVEIKSDPQPMPQPEEPKP